MILVFASSLYNFDPQVDLFCKVLEESDKDFLILNPLNFHNISEFELASAQGQICIRHRGKIIQPECFYMMRKWRTDCIAVLPDGCDKPTLYRNKVNAFLAEMAYAYKDTKWFPGTIDQVELADAKIALYSLANQSGLLVPGNTVNSFGSPKETNYRKSLSYPFSITYDSSEGEEIAVTLFNNDSPDDENGGIPWQWQSKIEPQKHIRSIFVGQSHWSFFVEEKDLGGKSLRERQEDEKVVVWKSFALPTEITASILAFMNQLQIKFACPEFIVDSLGKYYFIDMNPRGDWYGFGSDQDNNEIASAIVASL